MSGENNQDAKPATGTQAVDRALRLLRHIAQGPGEVSLAELCDTSGLNRTTVWRLLGCLENNGFVERDEETKGYRLGLAAAQMCTRTASADDALIRACLPQMRELHDLTAESVILAVPRYGGAMTVAQLDSPQVVKLKSYIGQVDPLHASSTGKVLLAALADDQVEEVLAGVLDARTERTITSAAALRKEIDLVRKQGYALVHDELASNESGIATAIWHQGRVLAALNVSGPAFRFTEQVMLNLVEVLIDKAAIISRRLDTKAHP